MAKKRRNLIRSIDAMRDADKQAKALREYAAKHHPNDGRLNYLAERVDEQIGHAVHPGDLKTPVMGKDKIAQMGDTRCDFLGEQNAWEAR